MPRAAGNLFSNPTPAGMTETRAETPAAPAACAGTSVGRAAARAGTTAPYDPAPRRAATLAASAAARPPPSAAPAQNEPRDPA